MTEEKILLQTSIIMTPCHLFGIAQFGDWNALACMPTFIVLFAFEKGSNVAMSKLPGFSVHCLVGFDGDAIEVRGLSRF